MTIISNKLRVAAAAVSFVLPVAAFGAVGVKPTARPSTLPQFAAKVAANPAMMAELSLQIAALPQWALPETSAASAASLPAADARSLQMRWLALGLAADPQARAAFDAVLSPEQITALSAQPSAMTPAQIEYLKEQMNLGSEAGVGQWQERLGRIFDQTTSEPASALDMPDSAEPAALERYLAQPGRTAKTVRGLKTAVFKPGHYDAAYEAPLRKLGYDAVSIETPRTGDLERFTENEGFFLKTKKVFWAAAAKPLEEFVAGLPGADVRSKFKAQLKQSKDFPPSVGPLTEDGFQKWRDVYAQEILSKPGGIDVYPADFVEEERKAGELGRWQQALFHDPQEPGSVVGGGLLWNNVLYGGVMTVAGAAYRKEFKKHQLSVRTIAAAMELAAQQGLPLVSYGSDVNFYGYDFSLGLMAYKASVHMIPFLQGPFELFKIISAGKFAEDRDHEGKRSGFLFFSVLPGGDLWQRYAAAVAEGRTPVGRELLGGRFLTPQALRSEDNIVAQQFHFPNEAPAVKKPIGIRVVSRSVGDE